MNFSKDIILPLFILLILDSIYLYAHKKTFEIQIASVQRVSIQPRYLGAIVCYALLVFGLYYFILKHRRSVFDAFLLGIVIYGVFDSTNYAIFKKWELNVAVMDMLWGGLLFGLTTYITYRLTK